MNLSGCFRKGLNVAEQGPEGLFGFFCLGIRGVFRGGRVGGGRAKFEKRAFVGYASIGHPRAIGLFTLVVGRFVINAVLARMDIASAARAKEVLALRVERQGQPAIVTMPHETLFL
jgi:hypothetical protein